MRKQGCKQPFNSVGLCMALLSACCSESINSTTRGYCKVSLFLKFCQGRQDHIPYEKVFIQSKRCNVEEEHL